MQRNAKGFSREENLQKEMGTPGCSAPQPLLGVF